MPRMFLRPMDSEIKRRMSPPLNLLTLGALTPDKHQVYLEDENIEKINFDDNPDVVAITVNVNTSKRAYQIAKKYMDKGAVTILGGIHVSAYTPIIIIKTEPSCAKEGEISNSALPPQYFKPCCDGLQSFDRQNPLGTEQNKVIGGGMICFDPSKGKPVCLYPATISEGRYYPGGSFLLKNDSCYKNTSANTGSIIINSGNNSVLLGKIAMRPGAVNMHTENNKRTPDSDGRSGGHPGTAYSNDFGDRPLDYCKKFRPLSQQAFKVSSDEIIDRRGGGNACGSTMSGDVCQNKSRSGAYRVSQYECR